MNWYKKDKIKRLEERKAMLIYILTHYKTPYETKTIERQVLGIDNTINTLKQ